MGQLGVIDRMNRGIRRRKFPPGLAVIAHPMPTQLAVVGWRSPINGTISISGSLKSCGEIVDGGSRPSGTPEMPGQRIDDVHTDGIDRISTFHEIDGRLLQARNAPSHSQVMLALE